MTRRNQWFALTAVSLRPRPGKSATHRKAPALALLACLTMMFAPDSTADLSDPSTWPQADASVYTTTDDPGWVFFRAYDAQGTGCGISPDGAVGCDIVVKRNTDGSVVQWGTPGPPGFYSCNPPGADHNCPLPPPGTNQVVADPLRPARYVSSSTPSFTRNVEELQPGYRLVNGGAWCYVSAASPGGINCKTGENGFLWSSWGGLLESAS